MRKFYGFFTVVMLAGAMALTGCADNKKKTEVAAAPPPAEPLPAPMVTDAPPGPPGSAAQPAPMGPDVVAVEPEAAPAKPIKPSKAGKSAKSLGGVYVVKSGDTLYGIARKKYHDPKMVDAIIKANPGIQPNHIIVGQKLNLP